MKPLTSILLPALLSLSALGAAAAPQGGGFTPGELILYSGNLYGSGPSDAAILRIDPQTGQVTNLLDITGAQLIKSGVMAYDPFRDRVLFSASLPLQTDPTKLWSIDAAGNLVDLGFDFMRLFAMTPAAGGRVYFREELTSGILYIDAANVMHTLMDASGTQPYVPPGWDQGNAEIRAMIYHPGTNALFAAVRSLSNWNCGTQTPDVVVHRIPLSADGSKVEGTPTCAMVAVNPNDLLNEPMGLSNGPGGELMLVVDDNAGGSWPRMNLIHPVTMAVTPWAVNDHTGSTSTRAGSWSDVRGQAIILDTFNDVMRAFDQGESGPGEVIVPSMPISHSLITHDSMTLVEVPLDGCESLVATYCTAKTTSGGCLPAISAQGAPSMTAGVGFTLRVDQVEPQRAGVLFYGQSGAAAMPFQGGFLCVNPPTRRVGPLWSGGSGACSGSLSIDFNAHAASGADPFLAAASVVNGQYWFRDPAHPQAGTGLSGGVTFTLCP